MIKDPSDIDGGTYMVHFRTKEMAEVMDCKGESFCQASPAVAVWLTKVLNARKRGEVMTGDANKIVEEMKRCGWSVPPEVFNRPTE